ncbi:MAG TPA: VWA domain-containing protein [Vicinamibacterales bacterium]|nr:VWA domain-containing protein [Vicinamibacterales bacterium]
MTVTGGVIRVVLFAALAALPAPTSAQPPAAPAPTGQAPRFKSSVDVVSVAAVVRDRKGRFVNDLSREDFQVVESGVQRKILDFRAEADGPVKVALLLDISGSMRVGMRAAEARQAARHVFAGLRPTDHAAVFTFDTGLDQVSGFTSDRAQLDAALDTTQKPYGQTSLYDATARIARVVAEESRSVNGLPQRAAVVVITDGIDTRSQLTAEQVAGIASEIDVPVYILAVMAKIDDPRERTEDEEESDGIPASRLQELARRTGGELFMSSAPAHASVAAREILGELRHQYVLAFEASTRPGWRPLEVRAKNGHVVRARSGYTAGGNRMSMNSGER